MLIAKAYLHGAPFRFKALPDALAHDIVATPLVLRAADFREVEAILWEPRDRSGVAVVAMHPRVDFTRHYTFPELLANRVTCLGANTRNPNNDLDTVHEEIVLDVGACVAELRRRNYDTVILLGNSGGGSLAALYQSQAALPPTRRIERAPGGMPTRLRDVEMPLADAMIYVAPHPGQGVVLSECIDPSVCNERDPVELEEALDMYAPANGFAAPPEWSRYDAGFVTRFRSAQRARIERIDDEALAHIEVQRAARRRSKHDNFATAPDHRSTLLQTHADHILTVYRTMANPHYVDGHLDPSQRAYGSLLSDRPDLMNVKALGFARVCTPRAWLSTWSLNHSNANMLNTLPGITAPTLFVSAGADREIYPATHTAPMVAALAAPDVTVIDLPDAEHYFQNSREELMSALIAWLRERFDV